ncbi:GTPase-associated protein 1-related protein [Streptomyces bacillaris]|uniref:GTPase-associated protein 1-related protein n=1 Tax=Streptomyces bacillaris TaxID=68179 RepID=UPI00363737B2
MSLGQLHYTSAPPGPDGSGFRFTALTPGLPQSVLREAEQLIGYEPPRNAPARPSAAELDSFPRAFSYSELSDGSRLLARTVYTGADYSGRWGNFHAHAVHLAPGQILPDGALPVSAWESPGWATATPEGGAPPPLSALPPSSGLDRDGLIAFAASRAPWLAAVFTDLQRQAEDETAPQIVLVERDSADVARWVVLASTVLPRTAVHRLTFTTYTRRPHLAGQRIIGVLPDDAHGLAGSGRRHRVHDCAVPPAPDGPEPTPWAVAAARIWSAGAIELFQYADRLPGEPFTPGPLSALALCAGIGLPSPHRTAAARWACEHPSELSQEELEGLVQTLAEPGHTPAETRHTPVEPWHTPTEPGQTSAGPRRTPTDLPHTPTAPQPGEAPLPAAETGTGTKTGARTGTTPPAETAALAELFARVGGALRPEIAAPLAARLFTAAVRSAEPVRPPGRGALTDEVARRLAAELGPELRAGIADAAADTGRALQLLRVAGALGVDCADLVPSLAHRLASALLADPSAYGGELHGTLADRPDLRSALLRELDAAAGAAPASVTVLLERAPLELESPEALPYLRMCGRIARSPSGGGDRTGTRDRTGELRAVLAAAGVSVVAHPPLLRIAFRLVWGSATPTPEEARYVLAEQGADLHRTAATWPFLVTAALNGRPGDPHTDELAHELLTAFPTLLPPRDRAALLLLEFARDLRAGGAEPGWVDRILGLRRAAEPVNPPVLEHVFGRLARQLLHDPGPGRELNDLIRGNDADLCAAYEQAAREDSVRDRLRRDPHYLAARFVDWNAHPQAGGAWGKVRGPLLDGVLRPAVRALGAQELAAVEAALTERGGRYAEDFRAWNRPGALSRLGLRFGSRDNRTPGRRRGGDS